MSENNNVTTTTPTAPLPSVPPVPLNELPHDSRQANIIVSAAICLGISTFFVGLRFYTRGRIIRVLGPSDWSILLALIFSAATTVSLIEQAVLGSGRHVWDLNRHDINSGINWGRSAWMGILFYLLSLCFSKVSILLLYIHLFAFKWARTAGQILLGIVIITSVFMLITTCTACIPLQAYWDFTLEKKYCHPQSIWWSNTGLHMVTDFLIFLIPMPVVWTIMLPKKQKLMLFGVFGLGFIVCFISILRLLQLLQVEHYPNTDFTWGASELSYLTAVEINGAIVVACIMTLKPLIVRHFPGLLISRRGSGSSSSSGPSSGGPRRGSATVINNINGGYGRGPPTIGSRPSKPPMGPVDSELMMVMNNSRNGRGSRPISWVREASTGYMELDDSWVVDVELAERGTHSKSGSSKGGHNTHGGETEEKGMDKGRENEVGVEKKNSTRSNDSDGTTLRAADSSSIREGDGTTSVSEEEQPPPVPEKGGMNTNR